ncbi:hypothetical protein D1003_08825 [Riemerella anatipestifer]|nr:hypothetical protein [Riemerella anatipestifer]
MFTMNKVLILYISLFIVEITSSFFLVFFYCSFEEFNLKGSFSVTILWNVWRVLFYGVPFIILYFLLFKHIRNINIYKPLSFSLFNLFVYVDLSILTRVIWGKNIPLLPEGTMFYVTCIATFISPLVLGQIPYFKKLIEKLCIK